MTNTEGSYTVAGVCLFIAEWIETLDGYHVPNVVMQIFQIIAWATAAIACLVGIYFNYKKNKWNRKN